MDTTETLNPLSPNQEIESPAIPAIVSERSEPGQRKADQTDRPAMFNRVPKHDEPKPAIGAIAKKSSGTGKSTARSGLQPSAKLSTAAGNARPTTFHATIGYITRKGVTKTAQLSLQAHSKQEADALMRQKIMSNGLRQAKSITSLEWMDKAPRQARKLPKAKALGRSQAVDMSHQAPKATRARSASPAFAQRAAQKTIERTRANEQMPAVKIGLLNFIPAVFAAAAGIGYGIAKGTFSK